MAASLLLAVVDRLRLVFANVVEDVQVFFLFVGEVLVQLVRNELVVAALERKQLSLTSCQLFSLA